MLINMTFYFAIKSETMLLGILPTNTERILQELLIYMITAARVVMTTKWKAKECPYSENWKNKMAEYAAMSKLQIIQIISLSKNLKRNGKRIIPIIDEDKTQQS